MSGEDRQVTQRSQSSKPFRLPSLSSCTRDLSLSQKPKKTFVPNIPPRRQRSSQRSSESDTDSPSLSRTDVKVKSELEQKQHKHSSKVKDRLHGVIQTTSIFEDFPDEIIRTKPVVSKHVRLLTSDSTSHVRLLTSDSTRDVTAKKEAKDSDDELSDLLKDNFMVNERLMTTDESLLPVELPLLSKREPVSAKKESPCKSMPQDIKVELSDMLTSASDSRKFFLLQLPDVLPIISGNKQAGDQKHHAKRPLSSMEEGYLGKLTIHRSGRAQLLIGSNSFDVLTGSPVEFLQQLVSIRGAPGTVGHMSVLGNVQQKMICVPNLLDAGTR